MVDLHSHILPCFDDGSKSVEDSLRLLKIEADAGVKKAALTPHYLFDCPLEQFLKKRQDKFEMLKKQLGYENIPVELLMGAEVKISQGILDEESLKKLCYTGTDYMLVELPMSYYREWIPYVLYNMRASGITPVIAHVERYRYFYGNTGLLYDIISAGSVAQVNADSVINPNWFVKKLIKNRFVHVIATDSHSVAHRPPRLKQAMQAIAKKYGTDYADYLKKNSDDIANNIEPDLMEPQKFKKSIFDF